MFSVRRGRSRAIAWSRGVVFCCAVLAACAVASPAWAATDTVTNNNDSGSGSLRAVIGSAAPGDTVTFSVTGTISLTSGAIAIAKDLTITGPGASKLAVDAGGTSQIFTIASGGNVSISGLTLSNGLANSGSDAGGAIEDDTGGALSVSDATFSHDSAGTTSGALGVGGAIEYSAGGALSVSGSTFSNDTAGGTTGLGGSGGAIADVSTTGMGGLTVSGSTFSHDTADGQDNSTGSASAGGAIVYGAAGAVSVSGSTFSDDSANGSVVAGGGALAVVSTEGANMSVSHSTFSNDTADGSGYSQPSIDGGGALVDGSTGTLTVSDSTFSSDSAGTGGEIGTGGAIVDGAASDSGLGGTGGAMSVSGSTFKNDIAGGGSGEGKLSGLGAGGALAAVGSLSVSDSTFDSDSCGASSIGAGGAVLTGGDATFSGSTFSSDSAGTGGAGLGGAVLAGGDTTSVSGSTFSADNVGMDGGSGFGGAIVSGGTTDTISHSTFKGNSAGQGTGGAIAGLKGATTISHSTLEGNAAGGAGGAGDGSGGGLGGAVASLGTTATISDSTLNGNSAGGTGGAGEFSGGGEGGAVFLEAGTATISDSTLEGNSAGGAAGTGAESGLGGGGAILAFVPVTLQSVTLDGNSVGSAPESAGSGIATGGAGGGTVTADATIVSGNTGAPNCDGAVAASSYSLEYGSGAAESSCGFSQTQVTQGDPKLQPLTNNGGPTETQALGSGSAAIDAVPRGQAGCPASGHTTDQRGDQRPDGSENVCDVGAYESSEPVAVATQTAYTGPTVILAGHPVTLSGKLTDSSGPVSGQVLKLTADGQSCTATTGPEGIASCSVTATNTLGPVTVSASFVGNGSYAASASGPQPAIQFAFPSKRAFVLGDQTVAGAGPSTTLTWFGNSWAQRNSLSGNPSAGGSLGFGAATGFDGFAPTVNALPAGTPPASCSGTWTTAGIGSTSLGTSTAPPASVPSYMGVLVSSQITSSGLIYSGDYNRIVVVKTSPGYTGNPDTDATGTMVATYCPSGGLTPLARSSAGRRHTHKAAGHRGRHRHHRHRRHH